MIGCETSRYALPVLAGLVTKRDRAIRKAVDARADVPDERLARM
jgi:hypothetical protein